ncbi:hypothetical protein BB561_004571 [Smittium simulii]|uniref:Uncharacterized protein n=1 Tax=Smittium simulii TaxID=133385 RepID=A0A2T9YFF3_9FUNG|nr:hypothetical protein BB561_004571 [Smittium simulii]
MEQVRIPGEVATNVPYSKAIRANGFIFISGQLPFDLKTGEIVYGDIAEQTRLCLLNMQKVLNAAGATFSNVVKTTVFLDDIEEWGAMNVVYSEFFAQPAPARSAIQVAKVPKNCKVEIECIAIDPKASRL